jgi:Protein of unknown function (DUF998)
LSLRVTFVASTSAVLALAALHVLSPELDPSWRMVSEYALGEHGGVLSLFFGAWAVASWALAMGLWARAQSVWARVGAALVALAGVGEAMGGLFDVTHPLHGAAFGLGVPSLAVGAVVVGIGLARRDGAGWLGWASQAPWVSVALMAGSFALCFQTATAAGIPLDPNAPWTEVPDGVIAVMGWANRLLVATYIGWGVAVAWHLQADRR